MMGLRPLSEEIERLESVLSDKDTEIERLKAINANLMGDDEDKPRYTTKRLRQEIERATATLESENASLRKKVKEMEAELDEAVNWNDIVDRHGLDQFDDLAERWLAMEGIQRVHNAVASVFSKWANDDLMGRFKQHMSNAMQMSFVEGCLVGIRTAEDWAAVANREDECRSEWQARARGAEAEAAALREELRCRASGWEPAP